MYDAVNILKKMCHEKIKSISETLELLHFSSSECYASAIERKIKTEKHLTFNPETLL